MKDRFMKNGVFSLEYDKETLRDMVLELHDENKKQKEVIDKAIEYINENKDKYYQDWGQDDGSYDTYLGEYEIEKLLDILNGVSNNE